MTRLLLIGFFIIANTARANDTSSIKAKIFDLCMSRFSRTIDTRKAVCDCSVKNLSLKNDQKELAFIYSVLKNKKAPKKLNDEQVMLVEYSTDVSEKCLENPKWTVNQ